MATQTVHATYQEIYDLSTKPGMLSVIGIHTPTGSKPYQMLEGFFRQYKKYKYNGITKMILQPAAQLPADPLQVSLEAGENLDPRDLLNPIMFHGAHGTDINSALNVVYKKSGFSFSTTSTDTIDLSMFANVEGEIMPSVVVENMYYSALSDPSFRKYGVQEVIQLGPLVPLVHRVNASMYFGPSGNNDGYVFSVNESTNSASLLAGKMVPEVWDGSSDVTAQNYNAVPSAQTLFTNGYAQLDWMPTRVSSFYSGKSDEDVKVQRCSVPKLYMGVLIMPPSYNQRLFYRCVITHSFSFSDFGSFNGYNPGGNPTEYYNAFETEYTASASAVTDLDSLNLTDAEGTMRTAGVM